MEQIREAVLQTGIDPLAFYARIAQCRHPQHVLFIRAKKPPNRFMYVSADAVPIKGGMDHGAGVLHVVYRYLPLGTLATGIASDKASEEWMPAAELEHKPDRIILPVDRAPSTDVANHRYRVSLVEETKEILLERHIHWVLANRVAQEVLAVDVGAVGHGEHGETFLLLRECSQHAEERNVFAQRGLVSGICAGRKILVEFIEHHDHTARGSTLAPNSVECEKLLPKRIRIACRFMLG